MALRCFHRHDVSLVTQVVLRACDDAVRPHLLQELLGALLGPHTPVSALQRELEAGQQFDILTLSSSDYLLQIVRFYFPPCILLTLRFCRPQYLACRKFMVTTVLDTLIKQYLSEEHSERAKTHLEETRELSE